MSRCMEVIKLKPDYFNGVFFSPLGVQIEYVWFLVFSLGLKTQWPAGEK